MMSPYGQMYKCGRCEAPMHPLQNARQLGNKIICMACYLNYVGHLSTKAYERARVETEPLGQQHPPTNLDDRNKTEAADEPHADARVRSLVRVAPRRRRWFRFLASLFPRMHRAHVPRL